MTNPTSNFGWQMPTSTDLVTDLPADFETFGQAVDTSMADLKGGTTGQILSKATNTDMDFVWITNDVGDITAVTAGTGISGGGTSGAVTVTNAMATTITTKGDLVPGTGSGTFARLAVGANDTLLVADSTAATGLKWGGSWTTWTPTVSGFTKGNGTEVARYAKIGKTVFFDYSFTFGSTSAMTGLVRIGVPVSPAGNLTFAPCGNALFEDKDTAFYLGSCLLQAYDYINVYIDKADGTYTREGYTSSTVPFTWANTDRFFISGSYEAA